MGWGLNPGTLRVLPHFRLIFPIFFQKVKNEHFDLLDIFLLSPFVSLLPFNVPFMLEMYLTSHGRKSGSI